MQAGVLLGELDRETQAFGLAAPSGIVTHTGVAGLTLGGGIGWIMRKHGLSVDQLRRVDVVTADGELVKASARRERGAVLGHVRRRRELRDRDGVRVRPRARRADDPRGADLLEDGGLARRCCASTATGSRDAPDELMTIVIHRKAPPLPFVPDELHGKPVVMVMPCWIGDLDEGEKFIEPMREFGNKVADVVHAEAVPRAPGDVRPELRAGPLVLLPLASTCRS